jgi:predicted acetylornithine/succinylornithine family transaminase
MKIKSSDNTVDVFQMIPEKGKGAILYDIHNKKYIDMFAGIAVNLFGYNDKKINTAIINQVKKYIHLSRLFYNKKQEELTELLKKNSLLKNAYFVNSGAEANEVAIKFARKWGILKKNGAFKIITMFNSFHGRTIATLTATGQEKFHKYLNPLSPGFVYAKFNDINDVKNKIDNKTVAIMLELIQAEGGVNVATKEFIQELSKICEKENLLLIVDEVQTGLGRTGKVFCCENYNLKPDMITLGKGLGGGLPLSAVLVSEKIYNILENNDHGTTMGGNPVACAAGCEIIKRIANKKFLENVKNKGDYLMYQLKNIKPNKIKEVRGMGLLIGCQIDGDAKKIVSKALEYGLILNACKPDVIRFVPPLIITEKQIDSATKILRRLL